MAGHNVAPECGEVKPQTCERCGVRMERSPGERPSAWARRRFCSVSCARQAGPSRPLAERLFKKTDTTPGLGPGGTCHMWTGYRTRDGYGTISLGRSMELAHRVSFTLHRGAIPDGLFVCHGCDTPGCVNPDHLFLGTHAENMHDMKSKGRQRTCHGTDNRNSKLTDDAVRAIRVDHRKHRDIATKYGVTPRVIGLVKRRLAWAHVE